MYTFQQLYDQFTWVTKDDSATNVARGKQLINDTYKKVCALGEFIFSEDEWSFTTVADQPEYQLPFNIGKTTHVHVTVDDVQYLPEEVPSDDEWERLTSISTTTSDIPTHYHIYADYIYLYPTPDSTDGTGYVKYKNVPREMTAADYTTGTVTVANDSSAVTIGGGGAGTAAMADRYIRFDTDGIWYKISAATATTITLTKVYEGTAITAGTFKIGQIPVIPDGFQQLLWQEPVSIYFMRNGEEKRALFYKQMFDEGFAMLKSKQQSQTTNQVMRSPRDRTGEVRNPNNYPTGLTE